MRKINTLHSSHKEPDSLTHALIQGDNMSVLGNTENLRTLGLEGTADTIYLDPPYNTGNSKATGFTYHDDYSEQAWNRMMRDALAAAKNLLKSTGVIIVSIDDNEVHTLRFLMDEVFGRKNFITQLTIDGGANKNNSRFFSVTHEYMLIYAQSLSSLTRKGEKWRREREGVNEVMNHWEELKSQGLTHKKITTEMRKWLKNGDFSTRLKKFYNSEDRGLYTYADLSVPGNRYEYEVLHPITQKPCQEPSRGWGLDEEKFMKLADDDMIIWGADETGQPLKKLFLSTEKDQLMKSVLSYPSRSSTHLLEALLGRRTSFNNPKNLEMMKDIIDYVTPEDGTVVDYFGGSGTTLHAVLALNEEQHSRRRGILITNNESNIFDEVTLPRVEAVLGSLDKTACRVDFYSD